MGILTLGAGAPEDRAAPAGISQGNRFRFYSDTPDAILQSKPPSSGWGLLFIWIFLWIRVPQYDEEWSASLPPRSVFSCRSCSCRPPLARPLGELSPKVTERVLQPVSNGKVNLFAHFTKMHVDIPIGKSQNLQAQSRQKCGTFCVICHALRLIMLRTVRFDHQFCRSTVKIHDKSADDPLFVNLYRVFAEKKIPELALMGCHFPAKPPGIFQLAVIFWYGHVALSDGFAASSPSGRAKCPPQTASPPAGMPPQANARSPLL